ncbi:general odorant-binding protein 56h [Drosophila rhopaloa]|uniref:General odorant-binding protein 56h n=1 Tax=Drosophila rhopaloa TaxID=1041015 RepID=A0A6P4EUF3_DRORH|nr:general odorant-binding protein 56h [Drosophila rhopaloa]
MRATLALTLLLSCLAGILSQNTMDPRVSKETVDGCMKENGVSAQDLADLQSGKVKHADAKDNVKCSTQCILVKSGYMDSTGKLLTDKIKAHYANTNLMASIEKDLDRCSKVKGDNACDTAFKMLGCFQGA